MKKQTLFFLLEIFFMVVMIGGCKPSPTLITQTPTFFTPTRSATATILPTLTKQPLTTQELLPHTLYYLGNDGVSRISQVYRMERDGKTITQLTFEPHCSGVTSYDVSPIDGTIVFIADNQLLLANADGSNRQILVTGDSTPNKSDPCIFKNPLTDPVFSPDGQTIAYSNGGLNLYDILTGVSKLVISNQRTGLGFPIEIYSPIQYSPDGKKLLVSIGQWEAPPATGVYYPESNNLVNFEQQQIDLNCCSQYGGPVWSADSSYFYGIATPQTFCCQSGELWKVETDNGSVTRSLMLSLEGEKPFYLPKEIYLTPDGWLYFFLGAYRKDMGFSDARLINMVRSAPDGEKERTVLRNENFVLMNEALWAPDASLVIVATAQSRFEHEGGVLELYYTDGQEEVVWLAAYGKQMKWGP